MTYEYEAQTSAEKTNFSRTKILRKDEVLYNNTSSFLHIFVLIVNHCQNADFKLAC